MAELREDVPEELRHFLALVAEERYWESHEVLEGPWRRWGSDFYHGLILYASAFVHVQRRNAHGVRSQLDKARRRLEAYAPTYLGMDVEGILAHARETRGLVEDPEPAWDAVRKPRLEVDPARVRGDEPERARRG